MSKSNYKIGNEAITLQFLADILFAKGVISVAEQSEIYEAKELSDLDSIIEGMIYRNAGEM